MIAMIKDSCTKRLPNKNRPRLEIACYAGHILVNIPGLISCTGVTGRWGLLSHAQNADRWLALSKRLVEALQRHRLFVQLSFIQPSLYEYT